MQWLSTMSNEVLTGMAPHPIPRHHHPVGGPAKRALDVAIAGIALLMLAPLMLMVAVLIRLFEGGPVLFSHPRIGFGGRAFHCFKFRTMYVHGDGVFADYLSSDSVAATEWATSRKLKADPRVSRLGRLLRETSIDELPQLFNVIRGDMSCVGPRPITVEEIFQHGCKIDLYFRTRPGLTGAWQVGGRNDTTYDERVVLDSNDVLNWSIPNDVNILARTLPAVISRRGSY